MPPSVQNLQGVSKALDEFLLWTDKWLTSEYRALASLKDGILNLTAATVTNAAGAKEMQVYGNGFPVVISDTDRNKSVLSRLLFGR